MMLFAYIALTLIIFRFLVAVINLISRLHLSEDQKSPDASLVSLLIPARNEGENIIRLLNDIEEQPFKNIEVQLYDLIPVLNFPAQPLDDQINRFIKRSFDITFSLLFLLFIGSWLIPLIALLNTCNFS